MSNWIPYFANLAFKKWIKALKIKVVNKNIFSPDLEKFKFLSGIFSQNELSLLPLWNNLLINHSTYHNLYTTPGKNKSLSLSSHQLGTEIYDNIFKGKKKNCQKKKRFTMTTYFFSLPDTEDLIDPSCSQRKKTTTTLA